jgi:hypothetical protein
VALFYVLGDAQPQVWFQDLACHWHFLAASFADYFRSAAAAAASAAAAAADLFSGCASCIWAFPTGSERQQLNLKQSTL